MVRGAQLQNVFSPQTQRHAFGSFIRIGIRFFAGHQSAGNAQACHQSQNKGKSTQTRGTQHGNSEQEKSSRITS